MVAASLVAVGLMAASVVAASLVAGRHSVLFEESLGTGHCAHYASVRALPGSGAGQVRKGVLPTVAAKHCPRPPPRPEQFLAPNSAAETDAIQLKRRNAERPKRSFTNHVECSVEIRRLRCLCPVAHEAYTLRGACRGFRHCPRLLTPGGLQLKRSYSQRW